MTNNIEKKTVNLKPQLKKPKKKRGNGKIKKQILLQI